MGTKQIKKHSGKPGTKKGYAPAKGAGRKGAPIKPERSPITTEKYVDYDAIKSNDIAWYNKNANQYSLATRTPAWAHIQGAPYAVGTTVTPSLYKGSFVAAGHDALVNGKSVMPGIMTINYLPAIGISDDANSPVNKAFNRLMSELYAKTSGSSLQFQQADLAMMICSLASLASMFASVKRMLGVKDFWVTRNLNYPRTLSKALGNADYDDMVKNFNAYANRLNNSIAQFNSIKIPSWFDIFSRQYALSKNVYMDEDSEFAQLFAYKPMAIWRYRDTEGKCYADPIHHFTKISQYLDKIDEALADWTNSSDLYLINGALQRAFKDGSFIFVEPFVESERVLPVVDEYLASQCMNMTILDNRTYERFVENEGWVITQQPDKNAIIFHPTINLNEKELVALDSDNHFIRSFKKDPTADDNMEMTRLTCSLSLKTTGTGSTLSVEACGTEVVVGVQIYSADGNVATLYCNTMPANGANALELSQLRTLRALSPFRFIPRVLIMYTNDDDNIEFWEFGDQYNYCVLSDIDLRNLHETALYSIWKPNLA